MSDYSQFFDDELRKRQEADAEAAAKRKSALDEKEAAKRALAEPLDRVLQPALQEAERQLAARGISLSKEQSISQQIIGAFEVFRHFRLERRRPDRGVDFSKTYIFRVYGKGNIEAGVVDYPGSRGATVVQRISLTPPESFSSAEVEAVVKAAIADLVANGR